MSEPLASSVSSGLERQIRKVLSVVLLLSLIELIGNQSAQNSQLNAYSPLLLGVLVLLTIGSVLISFFTAGSGLIFTAHGLVAGVTMLVWPAMVIDPSSLPAGFKPWIWWTLGIGILSFGLFVNRWLGGLYLVAVSSGWFLLRVSDYGASASTQDAVQDAVYLFLLGGTVIGMINLVRRGAKRADSANSDAIASAIEQARTDAVERERQRLDALIHDRVLNTLLLAAKAESTSEKENAAKLAKTAILALEEAAQEPRPTPSVTPLGLFRALRKAAIQLLPEITVKTLDGGSEEIPAEQATAITEATLQAIDNAARHSRASKIELVLDSPATGVIEVVVKDNGAGFRMDRLPRDRIGIKTSIIARMEAIGGAAEILSTPGQGTEVRLKWPR